MGTAPNCNFIGATLCPGSTGPSPLWVNKALLPGSLLGSGGSFVHNGACYSIPANAQPQPPAGGSYASAGYMGETSTGCADCCAVKPEAVYFDCSGTGTATINVSGPPGSKVYLSWSSCYLVVNGVGPSTNGGNTTVNVGSGGGPFTVGTSSAVCPIPCPGGPAGINVGTSPGGNECGSVAVYTGCPPCPAKPTSLTFKLMIPSVVTPPGQTGCNTGNQVQIQQNITFTCAGQDGWNWNNLRDPNPLPVEVDIACYAAAANDGSGYPPGTLLWQATIVEPSAPGEGWLCPCFCDPPSGDYQQAGSWIAWFPFSPYPDFSGAIPPTVVPLHSGCSSCDTVPAASLTFVSAS